MSAPEPQPQREPGGIEDVLRELDAALTRTTRHQGNSNFWGSMWN